MFSDLFGNIGSLILGDFEIDGVSFARLGRVLGAELGNTIDETLDDDGNIKRKIIPNLDTIKYTKDNPDNIVPLLYGTVRVGGQVLWTSDIEFKVNKGYLKQGKWGIFPTRAESEYVYSVSVAIGLCEGEIDRITNIYVNDRLISSDIPYRVYRGTSTQTLDAVIAAKEGADYPPLRHTAYIVLEDIPLDLYGKRLPNFSFDVIKSAEPKIENDIQSLCMIPASGEFVYATDLIQKDVEFTPVYENVHTPSFESDFTVCVGNLKKTYPNLKNVSLVVGWFFNHTDPAQISIMPGVETRNKTTTPHIWSVENYNRSNAWLVSSYQDAPAYGGTPSDESVRQGIIKLYQAGYKTTFYPFLFGDIPPNNPQNLPAFPWRGRIKPSGNATARVNAINHFFDVAGYKRMILHYAHLCKSINDIYPQAVDLFILGSELRGLTQTKGSTTFPAVVKLKELASQVRSILGNQVKITYAADWSEDGIVKNQDNSSDWPLDNLWSDNNIDYIAYDWYAPLTDWREGDTHLDANDSQFDRDIPYLKSRIEGGEAYDWYYASQTDRDNQIRTPITDGAYNEPWIYRAKDIKSRWLNYHYRRNTSGIRNATPTSWIPQSKKIIFTEIGCPAVNKGANSPNLFPDPKSSENGLPPYSNGKRDDFIQRSLLKAYLDYWSVQTQMIDTSRTSIWCIDARPFPIFPSRSDVWGDTLLFHTGHWIDGRGGYTTLKDIFSDLFQRANVNLVFDEKANQVIDGFIITNEMQVSDMIDNLVELYQLKLISQGNSIYISRAGTSQQIITDQEIIRVIPSKQTLESGGDGLSKIALHKDINSQKQQFTTKKTIGNFQPFIQKTTKIIKPDAIKLSYLEHDKGSEKNNVVVAVNGDNRQNIREYIMPITAFSYQIRQHLEDFFYSQRLNHTELALSVYNQSIKAGDIVVYNNQKYAVKQIKYANYVMMLTLYPHSQASVKMNVGVKIENKPKTDYALPTKIIKTISIGNEKYIGLSTKPPYGTYHLYKQAQGATTTQYVGSIKPQMIIGTTATDFYNRPTNIIDTDHDIWIFLAFGYSLSSKSATDIDLGYNHLAIFNASLNSYELISFEVATLVDASTNKYQLSRIKRGLRGSASAMGNPISTGAEIVIVDNALVPIIAGDIYSVS